MSALKINLSQFALLAAFVTSMPAVLVEATGPEPQWRSFILRLPADATLEDCPDVTADDSMFLLTHAGEGQTPADLPVRIGFGSDDSGSEHHVEQFDNTNWYFGGYATHITTSGTQTYLLYWQDEVPPAGSIAETGPDGTVMIDQYWVRNLATGEGDNTNGDWIAEDISTQNSFPFCHGMGLFSK